VVKIATKVIKNIKLLWNSIIPSIVGVAGSWNPNCQGSATSKNTGNAKTLIISPSTKTILYKIYEGTMWIKKNVLIAEKHGGLKIPKNTWKSKLFAR
jgi:hypothetical protein